MAEFGANCGTSDSDVTAMKEALQAQQQLLQKLYAELDQEREASATAASEAMSMILRLQGEKAAVKMEACQYKRLAEEKIFHAEESLEVFEDLISQKEMEIAALEFQVQAYKCKLLSLGCGDLAPGESRFHENLLSPGSDLHNKKSSAEMLDKKPGNFSSTNFSSYWQQIRDLDEQVKEITHCNESGRDHEFTGLNTESQPCSVPSQGLDLITGLDEAKPGDDLLESKPIVSTSCSSTIQDIFEVPKLKGNHSTCEKPGNAISLECNTALVHPTIGVADPQAKFQLLCKRVERLEEDRSGMSREIRYYSGEEERKLLREIQGQLHGLQAEIRSLKEEKTPAKDDQQVHCLKEAMLHFWS